MPEPVYKDTFNPVLLSSPPLAVTDEQRKLIQDVLAVASSDSRFAQKAYAAITHILTPPVVEEPPVEGMKEKIEKQMFKEEKKEEKEEEKKEEKK